MPPPLLPPTPKPPFPKSNLSPAGQMAARALASAMGLNPNPFVTDVELRPLDLGTKDMAKSECDCGVKHTGGNHSTWCKTLEGKSNSRSSFDEMFYGTLAPQAPQDKYVLPRPVTGDTNDILLHVQTSDLIVELSLSHPGYVRFHKNRWDRTLPTGGYLDVKVKQKMWDSMWDEWSVPCYPMGPILPQAWDTINSKYIFIKRQR
ncbi:MAG: hypothetical protein ACYDHY_06495 [Acidiferrobacterales bacterium]